MGTKDVDGTSTRNPDFKSQNPALKTFEISLHSSIFNCFI